MRKFCNKCKTTKSQNDFTKNKSRSKGLEQWCKECVRTYRKKYDLKNKKELEKYRKDYNKKNRKILNKKQTEYRKKNRIIIRIRKIKYKYNISYKEAEKLYNLKINGVCEICGGKEKCKQFNLSIDHNHRTGKLRGILCGNCNKGIGNFQDNIKFLKKAIKYLEK